MFHHGYKCWQHSHRICCPFSFVVKCSVRTNSQCHFTTALCVCMLCRLEFERRREEIEREFEEKVALIRREVELEKERLREELGGGGVLNWRSGTSGSSPAFRSRSSSPLDDVVHPEVEQLLGCEWGERGASRPSSTCESCSSVEEATSGVPPCHYRQVLGEESEPNKTAVSTEMKASLPVANGYVVDTFQYTQL